MGSRDPDTAMAGSGERSAHRYREAVGSFPTGVTVVTTGADGDYAGMTLNSFTSVSLNPLLVLVSLAHNTRTLQMIREHGIFTVSILHRGQRQVALDFAANGAIFPSHHVDLEETGHAPVRGALTALRCRVSQITAAGDHDLVLGEVESYEWQTGHPLVFHRGSFGGLDEAARTSQRQAPLPSAEPADKAGAG